MSPTSIGKLAPLRQQAAPLRNKIIAALRSAVELGILVPGTRLVEKELCEQPGPPPPAHVEHAAQSALGEMLVIEGGAVPAASIGA